MIGKFLPKGSKILDVGSGTGEFLLYMKKKLHDVYGLEPNKSARDISKNNGILPFENLKQAKGIKYKAITLWHVLEHIENCNAALLEIIRVLKKEGIIILAVPNEGCFLAKLRYNFLQKKILFFTDHKHFFKYLFGNVSEKK